MAFDVQLTVGAERDIDEIYIHIASRDGVMRADSVLEKLQDACARLAISPARGNVPKEFQSLGVDKCREIHYKAYRPIYEISGRTVIVYCIVDGRRDMAALLQRRLLR